ncbi:5-formyltetrahydrofolate cyclo-ligase [Ectothiorhodospiraceae bacterium 2226]|nr:5-formyltetrahydrofolate cyclo-ligase [Ectothiorhodospiraceae bacterium 2226]
MAGVFTSKDDARRAVWDGLVEAGVARFPFPPHGRIPNFEGAPQAAERLLNHPLFHDVKAIKVNADAPQRAVREAALARGIVLYVATPRLRDGIKRLDPEQIPPQKFAQAATLTKGHRWAQPVPLEELPSVDLVVTGAVGVTREGHCLGKGSGEGDIEYAILHELGHAPVPIVTTVHPLQILAGFPIAAHDLPLSLIATPDEVIEVAGAPGASHGIDWERLPPDFYTPMEGLRQAKGAHRAR